MPRTGKWPVPRTVPEFGLLKRRKLLSKKRWEELGRPNWVIMCHERYRTGKDGGVSPVPRELYYRCNVPACVDLAILIRSDDYGQQYFTGCDQGDGLLLTKIEAEPITLVDPAAAEPREGKYPNTCTVHWWDRSMKADTAQTYQAKEASRV